MAGHALADDGDARHPTISEVLFDPPKGGAGDANSDGERHATGDEFVELVNPHDTPIDLTGYTICNRIAAADPTTRRGVRFQFPAFTLGPGEVVVVFNGCESWIDGPVGTRDAAPDTPNDAFHGAWVFDMGNSSKNNTFANSADAVVLFDPEGRAVEVVKWGSPDPAPPRVRATSIAKKNAKGSVQRAKPGGPLEDHMRLDRRPHSAGEVPKVLRGG
ncbi:MAG: lamin tail domain-containing protein [Planctomycetota bacterium]